MLPFELKGRARPSAGEVWPIEPKVQSKLLRIQFTAWQPGKASSTTAYLARSYDGLLRLLRPSYSGLLRLLLQ